MLESELFESGVREESDKRGLQFLISVEAVRGDFLDRTFSWENNMTTDLDTHIAQKTEYDDDGFVSRLSVNSVCEPQAASDGPTKRRKHNSSFAARDGPPKKKNLSELERHYEKNIRPLLDAVDRLRALGISEEGIQLPSIVVVGDQSSGKSSVLESLASINLPRGQGISTRVPLILRLQRCRSYEAPTVTIEYGSVKQQIKEEEIQSAVDEATICLAGNGKGIIDTPICLNIRKLESPDLTMIDLPGITRVPVLDQPDDIYEQISAMIRHYIQPKECVILNVLSATVDFSTCESIRMSQKEDREGQRTLGVVTKVDIAPDGLYEKVTMDAVNIGLGYICVRNRAGNVETHEEAREKERKLFESHEALSKFDNDIVGISALAEKLTNIQANIIRTSLPGIVVKIESSLKERRMELQSLPDGVTDELGAESAFLRVLMENRTVLERLVVQGNFQGYSDDLKMHYTARLDEFFRTFSDVLHASGAGLKTREKTEEILKLMAEGRGVYLPNFLNATIFHGLVRKQIDRITIRCQELVNIVYQYVQEVVCIVIDKHTKDFGNLRSAYRRSAMSILGKTRDECMAFVYRELDKEGNIVHTVNDYYMENIRKIREHSVASKASPNFTPTIVGFRARQTTQQRKVNASPKGVDTYSGESEARSEASMGADPNEQSPVYSDDESSTASNDHQSATEMRISLVAYWKVVHKRLVDGITFELKYAFQNAIVKLLDKNVLKEKASKGASYMLNEVQTLANKRARLKRSVDVLEESYVLVSDLLKW